MATYYDVIGASPGDAREQIQSAIERTALRLKQSGQWEKYQDQYRKIENTLLDPEQRRQYDMQNRLNSVPGTADPSLRLGTPPPPAAGKPAARTAAPAGQGTGIQPRKGLLWAAIAVLVAGLAYGGWWLAGRLGEKVDEGIYLLSPGTGEPVGVVLSRDEVHVFPGRSEPAHGVLIYLLAPKKAAWVGEALIGIEYKEGDPAPEALLEEGREAAKTQDLHQSLR